MTRQTFRVIPQVVFGEGVANELSDHLAVLGADRVLLVSDPGIQAAGLLDRFIQQLDIAGIGWQLYDGVSPNPRDVEVSAAAQMARQFGAQAVVAIGGGSPIDLAKAASGLATNEGSPQDWLPPKTFTNRPLPLIAIPTTAGTGSEVTRSAVINDTSRMIKFTIRDQQIAPRLALVDPELTWSLPASITASTGMDALTHAIEAYTCRLASPITDALALQAIFTIAPWLPIAVEDGDNHEARRQMMMGSLIAGMAFGNSDVAAVHCIAEAIGGRYDTPHGVANSIFLPVVFDFNAETGPQRHAEVAVAMGAASPSDDPAEAAAKGSLALFDLGRRIGIPLFREIPGVTEEAFPWIAATSYANLSTPSNARELSESDYLVLLELAWKLEP